jgi:hypothetical protein
MLPGTTFPFCLLLRLAGLLWRYSDPPRYGCPDNKFCAWNFILKHPHNKLLSISGVVPAWNLRSQSTVHLLGCLLIDAVGNSYYRSCSHWTLLSNEFQVNSSKLLWPNWRYCPRICLEWPCRTKLSIRYYNCKPLPDLKKAETCRNLTSLRANSPAGNCVVFRGLNNSYLQSHGRSKPRFKTGTS